eukprot:3681960-Amphidinium_carterae.1
MYYVDLVSLYRTQCWQVNKNATISKQAMCIMESCVNDTFDRLTAEAGSLMRHAGSKGEQDGVFWD